MKMWQYFLLLSAIYLAPIVSHTTAYGVAVLYCVIGATSWLTEKR